MTGLTIDTHAIVKRFQEAGIPPEQAEAHTEVLTKIFEQNLVTKQDVAAIQLNIESVRKDIQLDIGNVRKEIEELRLGTKRDLKELEYRLKVWMGGAMTAGIGAIAVLVKIL